jgi:hypothetical protein
MKRNQTKTDELAGYGTAVSAAAEAALTPKGAAAGTLVAIGVISASGAALEDIPSVRRPKPERTGIE